jgi:hypothetical protein
VASSFTEPVLRRLHVTLLAIFVVWAVLAVIFGMRDLDIARAVVAQGSGWARFVSDWGELPGLLVILAALAVLSARLSTRGGGRADGVARVGVAVLGVATLLYLVHVVVTGLGGPPPLRAEPVPTTLAAVVAAGGVSHWWVGRRGWRPSPHALAFARAALWLAVVNLIGFVFVLKAVWGRVRFRDLGAEFAEFTAWYSPQGWTGHTSFPSGHTALGWMLLPLIVFALGSRPLARFGLIVLAVGWGLFVAAGRVRFGAHYPSDVLFSTAVAWVTFLIATRRDFAPTKAAAAELPP